MTKNKKTVKYSPKTLSALETVEKNKQTITNSISGYTIKRLNNINWLRHEISWNEPRILFYKPQSEQTPYFDYSCTKGLGDAYDYITNKEHSEITPSAICDVHYLICEETYIPGGIYRENNKILEMTVNGAHIHAPEPHMIRDRLEKIIYDWKHSTKPDPMRAFDLHYDLIMLQPFEDYNKRTARMIMNWALVLCGYRPIVFNKKTDKQSYIKAIKNMASGDSKSYYRYMYNAMAHSQNQIINQIETSRIK